MTRAPTPALSALVHQFADPWAFARELVQNAIDAGSNEVEVSIEHDAERGLGTITVRDFGDGMNREIIETRLTRMFSSAKDGDMTKIGRFGIGFVSVFALEPDLVIVDTARGGEQWRVLCHPDLTYEVHASGEPIEGTSVRIVKRMDIDAYKLGRRHLLKALRAWCRFVGPEVRFEGRSINEDLLDLAPVQVVRQRPGARLVAGLIERPAGWAGYYNRGLTLHQQRLSNWPFVSFRIDSEELEHTVSRDRVLEDARFHALMRELTDLVEGELFPEVARRLEAGQDARTRALSLRALRAHLEQRESADVPLWLADRAIVRMHHREPITLLYAWELGRERRLLVAGAASPVTEALHARGQLVAAATPGDAAFALLTLGRGRVPPPLEASHLYCRPLPVADTDADLTAHRALARAIHRLLASDEIGAVELGQLVYPGSPVASWVAVEQDVPYELTPLAHAMLGRGARAGRTIVLNVGHPTVECLALIARSEPEVAAYLVAKLCGLRAGLDHASDVALARRSLEERWTRSRS